MRNAEDSVILGCKSLRPAGVNSSTRNPLVVVERVAFLRNNPTSRMVLSASVRQKIQCPLWARIDANAMLGDGA